MVVAIDGPAGAGKSTVARALARELGFAYLDSGAMYRAVALSLTRRPGPAAERARDVAIELGDRIVLDGEDVTDAIRTKEISETASRIASDPGVRAALVAKQREMLKSGDWVGEGRDIGTVVAPHAELKIFLTASPEARARRRAADLGQSDWRVVMRDQALRDQQDSEREHSPLRAAPDSIELDSTDRPVEDVVRQIVGLVRDLRSRKGSAAGAGGSGAGPDSAAGTGPPA
jgi:cytidylate kinase